ncbi:MAG: hypothetical protein EOO13_10670 [Chitinophagaceae bacterium]|nr:MAG: hypothetical protein EOO13_10670 [Chitinophagaceae bacterium]
MKYACLVPFLFFTNLAFTQVVIEPNPSYTNSPEQPVLDEWLDAASLDGRTEPEIPNPSQKICFDKRMLIKARAPQGIGYTCVFVNTKIGLVGYTPFSKTSISCDLDVNDPNFIFNIIGLKGTHFNYYNTLRNGVLKQHVLTNNRRPSDLISSSIGVNEPVYKKDEQREFFGKVKAWEYKATGRTESWWMFGKTLPDKLIMQPNKYLGLFGVGYQYVEQGLFIILQLSGGGAYNFEAEILELEDVPTCFNSTLFRIVEENEMAEAAQSLQQAQERLDRRIEQNSSSDHPCKAYKDKVLKQNKKVADIAKQQVQSMQQGHQTQSMQQHVERELETAQLMVDGLDEDICKNNVQLARTQNQSSRQRLEQERNCLQQRREFEQQILSRFKSIKGQYPGQPAKAIKEMVQVRQDIKRKPCTN